MPPWGATDCHLGNNPLVLAVPRQSGPIVLDMAMSQFSFGCLETHFREGKPLSVAGGYTADGAVTTDPGEILNSNRMLPIGCWKGAGLAMLLDSLAALVSGGDTTYRIGQRDPEYGVSQAYIAVDVALAGGLPWVNRPLEIYTILVLEYLLLILVVSWGVRWMENRLNAGRIRFGV